jgi:hypothetical protein
MPNGKRHMILHLEDHGQDFLWWEVKDGEVIDAGPFQRDVWRGTQLLDGHVVAGNRLYIETPTGSDLALLNYPVTRIEYLDEEPVPVAVATGTGAAITGCGG